MEKLLNLALNVAASPGEIDTAGRKLINHLRDSKAQYKDLVKTVVQEKIVEKVVYKDKPQQANTPPPQPQYAPGTVMMNFGKHKGTPVVSVPKEYMFWALKNVGGLKPDVAKTMEDFLNLGPTERQAYATARAGRIY